MSVAFPDKSMGIRPPGRCYSPFQDLFALSAEAWSAETIQAGRLTTAHENNFEARQGAGGVGATDRPAISSEPAGSAEPNAIRSKRQPVVTRANSRVALDQIVSICDGGKGGGICAEGRDSLP